jgi:hypothetical protein
MNAHKKEKYEKPKNDPLEEGWVSTLSREIPDVDLSVPIRKSTSPTHRKSTSPKHSKNTPQKKLSLSSMATTSVESKGTLSPESSEVLVEDGIRNTSYDDHDNGTDITEAIDRLADSTIAVEEVAKPIHEIQQ